MSNFIGGIAGDIIGSSYEWHNVKNVDVITLFNHYCRYTDDSVLTCAVAQWLVEDEDHTTEHLARLLKTFGLAHPHAGYGHMFRDWLNKEGYEPFGSMGNGSGMRVSPVGFYASSYEEAKELAKKSAEVTHNHAEGIKGAQAIACAIYMAKTGETKEDIKKKLEDDFGYDLGRHISSFVTVDEDGNVVSRAHKFDATCPVTVPEAIIAFLKGTDYVGVIKLALTIGGDSDTIADMAGAIAGAYYGIPEWIVNKAKSYLSEDLLSAVMDFENLLTKKVTETDKYLEVNATEQVD